jgi:ATP-dependent Clp protease ATP-binding subunit ClpB
MNIEKYTERARGFIQNAQQLALGQGHQQFAPIHLLKVLLDDEEGMAAGLIAKAGGDARIARAETEAALKKIPKVSGDAGQLYLSRELARVFETAESAAQKAGDSFVTVERLLLALTVEKDTDAARSLPRRVLPRRG